VPKSVEHIMGAEVAVSVKSNAVTSLNNFNDTLIVKMQLKPGKWVILGRALLQNHDGDLQTVMARILHNANVEVDRVDIWATAYWRGCVYLQGTLTSERDETIELSCSTYKGIAQSGSLIAFGVDNVEIQ